jgi:hypothetical protein
MIELHLEKFSVQIDECVIEIEGGDSSDFILVNFPPNIIESPMVIGNFDIVDGNVVFDAFFPELKVSESQKKVDEHSGYISELAYKIIEMSYDNIEEK